MRNCRKTRHKTPLLADEQADMQAKIQYQGVSARETSFDAQGLNESERGPGYFTGCELAELASYGSRVVRNDFRSFFKIMRFILPIPSSMNIIYSNDRDRPRPTKMLMRRTISIGVRASISPKRRRGSNGQLATRKRQIA